MNPGFSARTLCCNTDAYKLYNLCIHSTVITAKYPQPTAWCWWSVCVTLVSRSGCVWPSLLEMCYLLYWKNDLSLVGAPNTGWFNKILCFCPILSYRFFWCTRPFWVWLVASHCGFTAAVVESVIFLTDKLIGLLVFLDYTVADLYILILQLCAGKVLHNASPERVSKHIGGGTQAVPKRTNKNELYINWKQRQVRHAETLFCCCKNTMKTFSAQNLAQAF